MPWRNGGGVTSEIARSPHPDHGSDFDWRISIAEVAAGGPFSAFPGIDRVLVRIGAAPLTLVIGGVEHVLERFEPCVFTGEADTSASLPGGPTSDLNVMTRRGRATAAIEIRRTHGENQVIGDGGGQVVIVALDGALIAHFGGGETALEPRDAVRYDGDGALALAGHGTAAVIALAPV